MDRSLKTWAIALVPLMLLVAVLMVSTVRYPSGKNIDLQTQTRMRTFILFLGFVALVYFYKEVAMVGTCLGYLFFGLVRHWRRARAAAARSRSAALNRV